MEKNLTRHLLLVSGILISLILIMSFLYCKAQDYLFMDLDIKWLFVAGIPILLSLILGGYIKSFKGFGVELEAKLKDTLPTDFINKVFFVEQDHDLDKESIFILNDMSDEDKNSIKRLRFTLGKRNYDVNAIQQYFSQLTNLKFIEIVNRQGEFKYLIPFSNFDLRENCSFDEIITFKQSVERGDLLSHYQNLISDYVLASHSLVEAYKITLNSYNSHRQPSKRFYLPVLNSGKKMIGIVYKARLEKEIAKEVIKKIDTK